MTGVQLKFRIFTASTVGERDDVYLVKWFRQSSENCSWVLQSQVQRDFENGDTLVAEFMKYEQDRDRYVSLREGIRKLWQFLLPQDCRRLGLLTLHWISFSVLCAEFSACADTLFQIRGVKFVISEFEALAVFTRGSKLANIVFVRHLQGTALMSLPN